VYEFAVLEYEGGIMRHTRMLLFLAVLTISLHYWTLSAVPSQSIPHALNGAFTTSDTSAHIDEHGGPQYRDRGHWIGISCGVQTNGGNLDERYAGSVMYEYRTRSIVTLALEYLAWRDRPRSADGAATIHTSDALDLAFKIRLDLSPWILAMQGGIGFGALVPLFNYSISLEHALGDDLMLSLAQKRYTLETTDHFFMVGLKRRF